MDNQHKILTFANKEKLLKTLAELPDEQVALVGYADENDTIRRLKSEDLMHRPTKQAVEAELKTAFREFMITGGAGVRFSKLVSEALWEQFQRNLRWRLDRLYEPNIPQVTANKTRQVQTMAGKNIGELPREYLFVKIPKTGTASINEIIKQFAGHRTASNWKIHYSQESWDKLFKFSIVRHPFDRFQSAYYHANLQATDINEWLKTKGVEAAREQNDQLFKTMTEYLYDSEGNLLVDYVGSFEEINKSWKLISSEIGIMAKLPHLHATDHKDKRVPLNDYSKGVLARYYAKDFIYFDYEP